MKAMKLENALRKIANSGDSDIIYGNATGLEHALKDPDPLQSLTELLENLIDAYEKEKDIKLHV